MSKAILRIGLLCECNTSFVFHRPTEKIHLFGSKEYRPDNETHRISNRRPTVWVNAEREVIVKSIQLIFSL